MKLGHDDMSVALTVERRADEEELLLRLYGDGDEIGHFGAVEPQSPYETSVSFAGYNGVATDLPTDLEVVVWAQSDDAIDAEPYCRECEDFVDHDSGAHVSPEDYFAIEVVAE